MEGLSRLSYSPDLILIYRKLNADILELTRLGSHSELGL
jgi:mRNA-degrading endonuclease YafQ of YafQ-DinJ toxin-antitoxin module